MNASINLIDNLNSGTGFIPSEKQCIEWLHEYVTHHLFETHKEDVMKHMLTGYEKTEQSLRSRIENLFRDTYVNRNFHSCGDIRLDNYIREKYPEYQQVMQYLAELYNCSRHNYLFG